MSAVLMEDRLPSEVGDSAMYNRLQMRRSMEARGVLSGEIHLGTELLRVLIVDDRDLADTMAKLVCIWGHDVRRAYDGITGLALAAAYQPHVILLDIAMPHMSGLEFALQVRSQPRLDDCFMIAVTGLTGAEHRRECEKAGVDLFLIKPVDPSLLQTLLIGESAYALQSRQDAEPLEVLSPMRQLQTVPVLKGRSNGLTTVASC